MEEGQSYHKEIEVENRVYCMCYGGRMGAPAELH